VAQASVSRRRRARQHTNQARCYDNQPPFHRSLHHLSLRRCGADRCSHRFRPFLSRFLPRPSTSSPQSQSSASNGHNEERLKRMVRLVIASGQDLRSACSIPSQYHRHSCCTKPHALFRHSISALRCPHSCKSLSRGEQTGR